MNYSDHKAITELVAFCWDKLLNTAIFAWAIFFSISDHLIFYKKVLFTILKLFIHINVTI